MKKKSSTQGHVFVVMLALLLQRELETAIADMDITVEDAIDELKAIRMQEVKIGDTTIQNIPSPTETGKEILFAFAFMMAFVFHRVHSMRPNFEST